MDTQLLSEFSSAYKSEYNNSIGLVNIYDPKWSDI